MSTLAYLLIINRPLSDGKPLLQITLPEGKADASVKLFEKSIEFAGNDVLYIEDFALLPVY